MSNEESEPQPLTLRFAELWGEQAAAVVMLGSVIRIAEGAIFKEDLKSELEQIKALVDEGINALASDEEEETPPPGFGFSKE